MTDFDAYLDQLFKNILNETRSMLIPDEEATSTVSLYTLDPERRKEVLQRFQDVRLQQQGDAEYMGGGQGRRSNPGLFHGSGLYTFLTEHLGDLLNRMTQTHCEKIHFGQEMVLEKVNRALAYIRQPYGFDREIDGCLRTNYAEAPTMPFDRWVADFDAARQKYVQAHKRLPVYNEMQKLARQVAIDHGERATARLEQNLVKLHRHLVDIDHWTHEASLVSFDSNGALRTL